MCKAFLKSIQGIWKMHLCRSLLCCVSQVLKNEGTVTAAPNFSPSGDAAVLDKAIKVKGEIKMATGELWSVCEHVLALQWASFKPGPPHSVYCVCSWKKHTSSRCRSAASFATNFPPAETGTVSSACRFFFVNIFLFFTMMFMSYFLQQSL